MGVEKNVIWGVSSTTVPLPLAGLHLILLADLLFFHSNLSFSFVVTHQDQREYLVSGAAAPGRKRSIPLLLYWPLLWLSHHLRTPQPEWVRLSYMPYTHTHTHTHTPRSNWNYIYKRISREEINTSFVFLSSQGDNCPTEMKNSGPDHWRAASAYKPKMYG